MRITSVKISGFKNLNDFQIIFDRESSHSVLIGQNAAGKSNFLEALVIIFRDLDLNEGKSAGPDFSFDITYKCNNHEIRVVGYCFPNEQVKNLQPKNAAKIEDKAGFTFFLDGEKITKAEFYRNKKTYFPSHIFSYYSGVSNRLEQYFDTHQRKFLKELLEGQDDPMRPLFYARLIHSHFVLMAFYGFQERKIKKFLKEYLNILGLESILFVLKDPYWYKGKPIEGGDEKFWYAKGVVKDFLNDLWDASLAPIPFTEKVREDFHKTPDQEHLYLYISNQEKLSAIAKKYGTNANFFKMLESTYISDLIYEVRVKVKKMDIKGNITFKELSEGEQQLLTVLGLMRFTKEENTLFLLDEPDTHLNPIWKWRYMELMENVVDQDTTSHVIMTTHDPLVVGSLTKEEVRIFYNSKEEKRIKAVQPAIDPLGMGVEGILTSEFFNLPTTLAPEIADDIDEHDDLVARKSQDNLSDQDEQRLFELETYLKQIGLNQKSIDPLYDKFLDAIVKKDGFKSLPRTLEEKKLQEKLVLEVLHEIQTKK